MKREKYFNNSYEVSKGKKKWNSKCLHATAAHNIRLTIVVVASIK
jgi:hypothetical protein